MTKNDLILMELNYRKIPEKDDIFNDYTIKRYINLAKFFDECDKDSNEDFTDIFKQISVKIRVYFPPFYNQKKYNIENKYILIRKNSKNYIIKQWIPFILKSL